MKDIMAGIDLHSNNLMLALVDLEGKRVFHKRLPCQLEDTAKALAPVPQEDPYHRGGIDFQLVLVGRWLG